MEKSADRRYLELQLTPIVTWMEEKQMELVETLWKGARPIKFNNFCNFLYSIFWFLFELHSDTEIESILIDFELVTKCWCPHFRRVANANWPQLKRAYVCILFAFFDVFLCVFRRNHLMTWCHINTHAYQQQLNTYTTWIGVFLIFITIRVFKLLEISFSGYWYHMYT